MPIVSLMSTPFILRDLGSMSYDEAFDIQRQTHEKVLGWRDKADASSGEILLVEHDPPVITVSRRKEAASNVIASPAALEAAGVEVCETDRGGDVTYHGPGQLVVYPIVDLNRLELRLHAYMRALEEAVVRTCAHFGLEAGRDPEATGVWIDHNNTSDSRKICALGVRVRRWVTMHGLALNVTTNLDHFDLIVPCGLTGRNVTSLEHELGTQSPSMAQIKTQLVKELGVSLTTRVKAGR